MAATNQNQDEEISGINVTPLVDIMLVLVIILMVTAEFTRYRTIPVQLPKVNASVMKSEPIKVNLTIRSDGILYWNDRKVEEGRLSGMLKREKETRPDVAVIVRAEGKTDYAAVLGVLDEVKGAGISKVGLATDRKN